MAATRWPPVGRRLPGCPEAGGPTPRPCDECPSCHEIAAGASVDVIEIDAASNRGIDEIRDIREKVGFRPNEGRFKVYVLDEAHMLTEPAFNALLKTLEEPPPHVIFALVTTDPHKIPATITSRCQRFDFKRIPLQAIVDRLAHIAGQEGMAVEPAAMELIARQGTGALRDAISLLDQLASYGEEIRLDHVQMVLGTVAGEAATRLVTCLADGNLPAGLELINQTVGDGVDPRQFGREVVEVLRGLLLIKQGAGTRLLNATAEQAAEMEVLAGRIPVERLLRAIRLFNEAATDLKSGLQTIPQLPLEMALVEAILGAAQTPQPREPVSQAPSPSTPRPEPKGHRVAEKPAPAPVSDKPPVSEPPAEAGALALQQVEQAWEQVLQAVRQRNPATQGVLNTGCRPVEVNGDEIVVTFPFPFLREKLGDPQRKTEIQDALSEVLRARCRLKLVLAAEYTPRPQGQPAAPPAQPLEDEALDQISRWAEERGGQTTIVQP